MSQFSTEIRRSPEWWAQFKDESFRNKWIEIGLDREWVIQTPSQSKNVRLSRRQVLYALDELDGYDALRDEKGKCQVSCFERIWESDSFLGQQIQADLIRAFELLRQEAPSSEDGVITHIIDHRLFPLIYNKTLVSHLNGRQLRTVVPPPSTDIYTISQHFSFLPSDIFVSPDGSSVKFLSYINNLHPQSYQETYRHLETLLAAFIPAFEHTLTDLHRNNPLMQRIPGRCWYTLWDEPEPPEHSDDEEGWSSYESELREWTLNRPISLPDVPESGYPGGLENRRYSVYLRNRRLQVIVNASEIVLSPQVLSFSGSPWHVAGMRSERIVACGFHCLSTNNITQSFIKFRMAVTYPRGFSAGDNGATLRTWGIRDGDSCHQYIGEVPLRAGLSLVFPNIYQSQQTSFTLEDPSQEGHLKAIWFYLVDPDIRPIISTSVVSPQQKSWIRKALDDNLDTRLPNEVLEKILEYVEGVMTLQEAEEHRKTLIEATEQFTQANNSYHFCIPFDVWNGPEVLQ